MAKPPVERSSPQEITKFLQKSRAISEFVEQQPRLMFAVDATASRQPTWDHATHLQQEMFLASVRSRHWLCSFATSVALASFEQAGG